MKHTQRYKIKYCHKCEMYCEGRRMKMCVIDGCSSCVSSIFPLGRDETRRSMRMLCVIQTLLETADLIARSADLYLALIGSYISADRQILCVCLLHVTDVDLSSYRSRWSSDSIIETRATLQRDCSTYAWLTASCVRTSALPPRGIAKLYSI